ncbi:MAG: Na+/H+ antiporter NhaA [Solirubrobacteraceae bacterium]
MTLASGRGGGTRTGCRIARFFLVVGLEAKRELDMGDLRQRRRLAVPVLAALGGMLLAVPIYLASGATRDGWALS